MQEILIDNVLPVAITIFSGWMLFEFLGLCHAERKFLLTRSQEYKAWAKKKSKTKA